jgi:hypothetical protein
VFAPRYRFASSAMRSSASLASSSIVCATRTSRDYTTGNATSTDVPAPSGLSTTIVPPSVTGKTDRRQSACNAATNPPFVNSAGWIQTVRSPRPRIVGADPHAWSD